MSTSVRTIRTRFSKMASAPGGMTLDSAVARAERHIESLREPMLREIDARVAQIDRLFVDTLHGGSDADAAAQMRGPAEVLTGLCGLYGQPELGRIAASLCRMLDGGCAVPLTRAAVRVHLEAIALVRSGHDGDVEPMLQALENLA